MGSHLDSFPKGGIFDGALGTYGALETFRALQTGGEVPRRPIEIKCFTEEEGGRFGVGTLSSSVATGRREVSEARPITDHDGRALGDVLHEIGFSGEATVETGTQDFGSESTPNRVRG